ncbi:MAG: hypothetical protein KDB14_04390 [Planctomycetales bacterium]|nr:hypothetical protein [Planctomycetales bacterium]
MTPRATLRRRAFRSTLAVAMVTLALAGIAESKQPPVTAVAISPDGEWAVAASQHGLRAYSWRTFSRQPTPEHDAAQSAAIQVDFPDIHALAFSPDGRWLAVAGGVASEAGIVELVAWPGGAERQRGQLHRDMIASVAWQSSESLATGSLDHDIRLWSVESNDTSKENPASLQPSSKLSGHSRGVTSLCFVNDQTLVSAGIDQNLRVWNVQSGELVRSLNNHTAAVQQVAARPGHRASPGSPAMEARRGQARLPWLASASDDGTVRLWQPTIGRMVRFVRLDSAPLAVAWSLPIANHAQAPAPAQLFVVDRAGTLLSIDPDTAAVQKLRTVIDGWCYCLAAHPTNGSLLVGGENGQLQRVAPASP